jgi:hypothetical protein
MRSFFDDATSPQGQNACSLLISKSFTTHSTDVPILCTQNFV